jgi:C4-dicarboxylate-specific signal transduction histidine kinase
MSGSQRREHYDDAIRAEKSFEISVADNGSGLAPKVEEHPF